MKRDEKGQAKRRGARRFIADERGMSAVEFALLLPFMVLLYLGGFELAQGIAVNRMVALTASTVTNLVVQYTSISAGQDMPDILNSSTLIMTPYAPANAAVIVSCITIDAKGNATVTWSQALHAKPRTVGSAVSVPGALDTANTTLILGEASYAYTPAIDFLKLGVRNLTASVYMFPRASPTITLTP